MMFTVWTDDAEKPFPEMSKSRETAFLTLGLYSDFILDEYFY